MVDRAHGVLAGRQIDAGLAADRRVDLTERHEGEKPFSISGTKVRAQLQAGERPDPRIMRESTAKILVDYYKSQA